MTGDDFGDVKLFNYPCIIQEAPYNTGKGHSSHVLNVRFQYNNKTNNEDAKGRPNKIISVGGKDSSIIVWKLSNNKLNKTNKNYENVL